MRKKLLENEVKMIENFLINMDTFEIRSEKFQNILDIIDDALTHYNLSPSEYKRVQEDKKYPLDKKHEGYTFYKVNKKGERVQLTPTNYLRYNKKKPKFKDINGIDDQINAEYHNYSDFNNLKNNRYIIIE